MDNILFNVEKTLAKIENGINENTAFLFYPNTKQIQKVILEKENNIFYISFNFKGIIFWGKFAWAFDSFTKENVLSLLDCCDNGYLSHRQLEYLMFAIFKEILLNGLCKMKLNEMNNKCEFEIDFSKNYI